MKTVSSALQQLLDQEVTTLATCWKITRRDGVVSGYTDHTESLMVDGLQYDAVTGFLPSAVESSTGVAVDNLDVVGLLDSAALTEADITAGLYDHAAIKIFLVVPEEIAAGTIMLRSGHIGEITMQGGRFVAEVRGLSQALSGHLGELYSPLCRAKLGDARCNKDLTSFTHTASVTAVASQQIFTAAALTQSAGYFDGGHVTFTSGDNDALQMEVKRFSQTEVTLMLPMPFTVGVFDTFTIIAGCDKTFSDCIDTFDNAVNFRGEPHIPGIDKMLETAGTRNNNA